MNYDVILRDEIICCIALILRPIQSILIICLTLCQSIIPCRVNVMMLRPLELLRLVGHLGSCWFT